MRVVFVEGNIGCGKSTLLSNLADEFGCKCVQEPVNAWTAHLHGIYSTEEAGSKPWPLPLQTLTTCTRMERFLSSVNECLNSKSRLLVVERSNRSARLFAKLTLSPEESHAYALLDSAYAQILDSLPVTSWTTVYMSASASTCSSRVTFRSRASEADMSETYLEKLHDAHEQEFSGRGSDLAIDCTSMSIEQVTDRVASFLKLFKQS